jgi:hypothetical protein
LSISSSGREVTTRQWAKLSCPVGATPASRHYQTLVWVVDAIRSAYTALTANRFGHRSGKPRAAGSSERRQSQASRPAREASRSPTKLLDRQAACVHDVIADPVVACAPFSGVAGTRLCYGRTIGSRDPRLQVAADRCGLLIVSPCDSIARSDELRLEM